MTSEVAIQEQGGEFSRGWTILLASFVGVAVGLTGLPFYSYGVFSGALEAEFGWSRTATQLPLAFQTLGAVLVLPFVGWACDKFGARPIAILSLILYGFAFAGFALLGPNAYQYWATAFLIGFVGAGTTPVTWTRAINGAFNKNRGIALGAALMGTGLTGFVAPLLANAVIDAYGWRVAFLALAGLPILIGIPVITLLFRERTPESATSTSILPGLTAPEAVKTLRFIIIAAAFFIISFGIGGSIPNLFPLYVGSGFEPAEAAQFLSLVGLSVIVGRIATGFLLDRFWAPAVAACLMCLPAISCFLLVSGEITPTDARIATILLGLAAGAEFDIIAFLASRYFGLRAYSLIYSFLYISFSIGAAIAPPLFGYVFDTTGSYDFILLFSAGMFMAGGLSLLSLGKYPEFEAPKPGV